MADNDVTRIAGNIGAMNALYSLQTINKQLSIHQTRLATGKRINSAADDPAGLAISTKMMARSQGLKVALSNIGDAKNLLAVAESGLGRLNDILIQMRNIAENAANDTNGTEERIIVKEQLASYAAQINDIVDQTKWSDKKLISGSFNNETAALIFQTGVDKGETTKLFGLKNMDAVSLGLLNEATPIARGANMTAGNASLRGISAVATGTLVPGRDELKSGNYTVEVTIQALGTYNDGVNPGGTTAADETYLAKVQLKDADGTIVKVDQDGSGAGTSLGDFAIVSYTNLAGENKTVDLGNGLSVTLENQRGTTVPVEGTAAAPQLYTDSTNIVTYSQASTGVGTGQVKIGINEDAEAYGDYMELVDLAMKDVNTQLSKIGSLTGSLTFKEDQISSSQINIEASYNRIMNANMAEEQVNASKLMILQQTSTAMLAQANAAPQFLLSLFR